MSSIECGGTSAAAKERQHAEALPRARDAPQTAPA
jgi:hypothetical protein